MDLDWTSWEDRAIFARPITDRDDVIEGSAKKLFQILRVLVTNVNTHIRHDPGCQGVHCNRVAAIIFQARQIPEFDSILATATRWHIPKEGDELVKEVMGYYFFPRLGFNADPKNADEFVDIPEKIRGKKLLAIMRDPDLHTWWKGNGKTIEVKIKLKSKRSLKALNAYLAEKNIRPQM